MWIASDPRDERRRVAFGDEQQAQSYAEQLDPAWTVHPADDPHQPPITGIRVEAQALP
jgi:hypothetical protein